jgi:hypothetical protein
MLKKQMEFELEASGYNFVPKSFWAIAFDPASHPQALAKAKKT